MGEHMGDEERVSLWRSGFVVVLAIQFVNVLVNGSTTMALPSIQDGLGAQNSALQWFAALFSLAFSLVLVLAGRLGDLFGPRRLLLWGYTALIVSFILEAISPTIAMLLVARTLQGLAGGMVAPQLAAVIPRTFNGHSRTRAFSVNLTMAGGGFLVGQLVGGALMSADLWGLGWRWSFVPFIPIAIVVWFYARRAVPEFDAAGVGRLDLPGAVILAVVSFLMMFPLIQGRRAGWPMWIFVMLVSSIPIFMAFISYERRLVSRGGSPLVNPLLFGIRTFRTGLLITLLTGLASAALPLFMILTVQIGFGRNALEAALISAPMPLANMAGSLLSAVLLRRFGRLTVLVGAFGLMLCAVLMLTITARGADHIDVIAFIPGFMLLGFSLGISISAGVAIVLSNVPQSDSGAAAGVQATGLQLSSSLGIAVFGVPFYAAVDGSQSLQPYLDGLRWVMWIAVGLVALQVLFTFRLPRHGARDDIEIPITDNEFLVFPDLHDVDTDGGAVDDHQT